MSKLSKINKKSKNNKTVKNFMDGTSYVLDPLNTLKIVLSSQIFGEKSFYRYSILSDQSESLPSNLSSQLNQGENDRFIEDAIDAALSFDFKSTLDFAVELRNDYFMRLNPAILYVRALMHNDRISFTEKYPGYFKGIADSIILIPSDISNMFEYYIYRNNGISKMPSLLKRTMASKMSGFSRYHIAKYKSKSLINIVRVTHASSTVINELMKTGTVNFEEGNETWEKLKSEGKNWGEIIKKINIPHMALLRNLRGIALYCNNGKNLPYINIDNMLNNLEAGVLSGKQFPFRYYTAYNEIKNNGELSIQLEGKILDSLNRCIQISIENFPKLSGNTISLCDNSGSAHGTFNSEYGSVKVSDIANLSGIITASCSENGYVGVFGDRLNTFKVNDNSNILEQLKNVPDDVGQSTENGLWLFFKQAIENNEHWDNVFIYSDMQAGRGNLYGINPDEYSEYSYAGHDRYIDLMKLVKEYRCLVNPKLNIFSVQVAGYNNNVLPENLYRGAILSGWTGKETLFASKINKIWDEVETSALTMEE